MVVQVQGLVLLHGLPPMKDISKVRSRRKTVFSGKGNLTPMEKFIDAKIEELYNQRHPSIEEAGEAALINSFEPASCPYCGKDRYKKYGRTADGIQRYKCLGCGRTFTIETGTIFDQRKIPISEWVEFLEDLLKLESYSAASRINRNAYNTTIYWMDKVFLLLRGNFDYMVLSGEVYYDET